MRISDWSSDVCSSDLIFLHHLGDADDRKAFVRVIEEAAIAFLHRLEIGCRLVVAHAVPMGPPVLDELVPRIGGGFGFHQPMGHVALSPGVFTAGPSSRA